MKGKRKERENEIERKKVKKEKTEKKDKKDKKVKKEKKDKKTEAVTKSSEIKGSEAPQKAVENAVVCICFSDLSLLVRRASFLRLITLQLKCLKNRMTSHHAQCFHSQSLKGKLIQI